MKTTLHSVQRLPRSRDVLVTFDPQDVPLRNVTLVAGSEHEIPEKVHATLAAALAKAEADIESANAAFAETREGIDAERSAALASFNAVAEELGRAEMARLDTPPEEPKDAK